MFRRTSVLIVEDEPAVAIDIAFAVSDRNGEVVGPVSSVVEAFRALKLQHVDAAILDLDLRGHVSTPLALHLLERGIPFIFHTANALPAEIMDLAPDLPVLLKPSSNEVLMESLAEEIRKRTGSDEPAA